MCGIYGKVSTKKLDVKQCQVYLEAIEHRGPDNTNYYINSDSNIFIGSTRLSIQDVSTNSNMPLLDLDLKITVAQNGEIYNFKEIKRELSILGHEFITSGDTEVVLKAYKEWGMNCISRFTGMFAISILDERINRLFLVRDRVGEKPLYYFTGNNLFCYSSELRPFLIDSEIENKINYTALAEYLQYGYVGSSRCLLDEVCQLKPGNILEIDILKLSVYERRYWVLPEFNENTNNYNYQELKEKFSYLFTASVGSQLVSDVPIGVFLSGGLDSSLITGVAASIVDFPLKSFHVSMDGYKKLDERRHAKIISDFFSTDHTEIESEDITFDKFYTIIDSLDQPMADSSYIVTFQISELARKYVKVVLGGDGGDELFAGYNQYLEKLNGETNLFSRNISRLSSNLPVGLKGRNYLLNTGVTLNQTRGKQFFDDYTLLKLLGKEFSSKLSAFNKFKIDTIENLNQLLKLDFTNYLPDDVLFKVDRASMANSLETRAPFLDKDLVEFAFGVVPEEFKLKGGIKKFLVKEFAAQILPKNFEFERKQGFSFPLHEKLMGDWKAKALDLYNSFDNQIFNNDLVSNIIRNEGVVFNNSNRIYAVLVLQNWISKYQIKL